MGPMCMGIQIPEDCATLNPIFCWEQTPSVRP